MYRPFESLPQILREKRIRVRFPRGYRRWRRSFYQTLEQTKGDVVRALDKIQGNVAGKNENENYVT